MRDKLTSLLRRILPISVREPINRLRWPTGAKVSFSAFGEDLIVRSWLEACNVQHRDIRYLDIGASHPTILSNTYLLYRIGGSGVLVEPSPIEGNLQAKKRPRDTLIRAGAAFDNRREATLYQFPASVFNTFDEGAARSLHSSTEGWTNRQRIIAERRVPLVPVDDIVAEHFGPGYPCHFLSIDAEGVDDKILQSIDFGGFVPWIICAEGRPQSLSSLPTLLALGYQLLCITPHNSIFAHKDKIPF